MPTTSPNPAGPSVPSPSRRSRATTDQLMRPGDAGRAPRRSHLPAADVARLRLLRTAANSATIGRLAVLGDDDLAKAGRRPGGLRARARRGQTFDRRARRPSTRPDQRRLTASAIARCRRTRGDPHRHPPLVREIGDRWHHRRDQYRAGHMVTRHRAPLVIAVSSRGYLRADNGPCLVLATLSGERHELGILMLQLAGFTTRGHDAARPGRSCASRSRSKPARKGAEPRCR